VLGAGTPYFPALDERIELELVETRTFGSRVVYVRYRVSRRPHQPRPEPDKVSEQLQGWLSSDADKTLGSLIDVFGEKGFAICFVLLLGVPALPLPTGGVTHVFEIIAVLLAVQLIAGRKQIWLPKRWIKLEWRPHQQRFINGLMRMIRRIERFLSAPAALPFDIV